MNRIGDQGTNSEHCLERIGSGAQMCNGTQIFKAVTLLLQRIIRSACAFHYNLVCLHLKGLFCTGRLYNRTCYNDSCSDADFGNICIIIQLVRCVYNLRGYKEYLMSEKVTKYLVENANVTETEASTEETTEETTEAETETTTETATEAE